MKTNRTPLQNLLTTITLLLLSTASWAQATLADTPTSSASGFEPSVIETESELGKIFDELEYRFKGNRPLLLQFGTQCTQRAHVWSYELNKTKNLKLQKVFVFYTHAYHAFYAKQHGKPFKWWFHVSPYAWVRTADGSIQERVIDGSFAEKPQTMKEWTDLFVESKEPCIEGVPFREFEGDVTAEGKSHNAAAHCYIVRAPMFDLFPADADAREKGQKSALEWDANEVHYASKALTAHARQKFMTRVGL